MEYFIPDTSKQRASRFGIDKKKPKAYRIQTQMLGDMLVFRVVTEKILQHLLRFGMTGPPKTYHPNTGLHLRRYDRLDVQIPINRRIEEFVEPLSIIMGCQEGFERW